ncbi:hypothetical protein D6829_00180 [Candidatus Pacearchaeota archaeon]|nr:MAG: hypothetical protein D6829_00180 [Candidatus Pacearchaeota archaeon]
MAALDRILELQQQGYSDEDIVQILRNEGVSTSEIQDALNQARIKSAVSAPVEAAGTEQIQQQPEGSIQPQDYASQPQDYAQAQQPAQEPQAPQDAQYAQQGYSSQYPSQEQSPEAYYAQTPQAYDATYSDYYSAPAYDTETISEIAGQVVSERIDEIKKEIEKMGTFRIDAEARIKSINERLKRIEDRIELLVKSVIGKIGEFGENTEVIKKDLDNLHNTVSKLMNPLIDTYNELKKKKPRSKKKK